MAITALESVYRLNKMKDQQYQAALNNWNQWFSGVTQQSQQQAQTQANYDISQAYENFRQNQRAIMNTAAMAEGAKERSQATLESQFAGAESQIRSNMAANVASAYQKNLETYQKGVEQATKEADTRADLKGRLEEYIRQRGETEVVDKKTGKVIRPAYFTYATDDKGKPTEDYYSKYLKEDMMEERVAGLTAARFSDLNFMSDLLNEKPELYYEYMSNRSWIDPEMFDMDNLSDMGTYNYEERPAVKQQAEQLQKELQEKGINTKLDEGTSLDKTNELTREKELSDDLGKVYKGSVRDLENKDKDWYWMGLNDTATINGTKYKRFSGSLRDWGTAAVSTVWSTKKLENFKSPISGVSNKFSKDTIDKILSLSKSNELQNGDTFDIGSGVYVVYNSRGNNFIPLERA